jgi:hypothetical protein
MPAQVSQFEYEFPNAIASDTYVYGDIAGFRVLVG